MLQVVKGCQLLRGAESRQAVLDDFEEAIVCSLVLFDEDLLQERVAK